jgi:hypothetical protein
MHNGGMHATSRLVIVWTSVSLMTVGAAWLALDSALDTATTGSDRVSAFDPSVLGPTAIGGPAGRSSKRASAVPSAVPAPAPDPVVVTRSTGTTWQSRPRDNDSPPAPAGTASPRPPPPSPTPTKPRPTLTASPVKPTRSPEVDPQPDEVVRSVRTDGGRATLGCAKGVVSLRDHVAEVGYDMLAFRKAADAMVVRFVGEGHTSTIYAYLDENRVFRITVQEEDT